MSQRQAKRARQEQRVARPPAVGRGRQSRWSNRTTLWIGGGGALIVVAIIAGVLLARGNGPAVARVSSSGGPVSLSGTSPITGKPVDLASYAGKPVVINIWASWCTGCRQEARDLAKFVQAHPEVQVVGLDTQDTTGGAKGFYQEFGWKHPSIFDPSGSLAANLSLQGLPTTLFLDSQHRLVTRIIGATNTAGFNEGLNAALNGA